MTDADGAAPARATPTRDLLLVAAALIGVLGVHVWLMLTSGTRAAPTHYYDLLADAFLHGQTHLRLEPAPELLALKDPYDAHANQAWRLHDAILFRGRFYLYWGPAPALFVAVAKAVGATVQDRWLVLLFTEATMVGVAATLLTVRWRWFAGSSVWPAVAGVLSAGLALPVPFLFARPSVYEAAIMGGQCFLVWAIYGVVRMRGELRMSPARLLLAGTLAALAVASRLNLAPLVAVLIALAAWELSWRRGERSWRRLFVTGALLAAPLAATVLALSAYNHARFGSFRESGVPYMLASRPGRAALQTGQTFSRRYVVANLWNYAAAPVRLRSSYPFVAPDRGFDAPRPRYFRTDFVAGLLVASPFFVLALVPAARGLTALRRDGTAWPSALLWTATPVAAAAPLLAFFYCSGRYLADVTPGLAILSAVGVWLVGRVRSARGVAHVVVGALLAWSCAAGVALAVVGYASR